jgi:hypothetical protein
MPDWCRNYVLPIAAFVTRAAAVSECRNGAHRIPGGILGELCPSRRLTVMTHPGPRRSVHRRGRGEAHETTMRQAHCIRFTPPLLAEPIGREWRSEDEGARARPSHPESEARLCRRRRCVRGLSHHHRGHGDTSVAVARSRRPQTQPRIRLLYAMRDFDDCRFEIASQIDAARGVTQATIAAMT